MSETARSRGLAPPDAPDASRDDAKDAEPTAAPNASPISWRDVRAELLRRINERVWRPGDAIPNEADLADEFDCARTTVNRALRDLAEHGLVTRKRRAGTRVAVNPAAHARLRIPVIREEVEANGASHAHVVLERRLERPPAALRGRLGLDDAATALRVLTLHRADGRAYALDDRWINLDTVPHAAEAQFHDVSPNEWLVQNAPYTHGEIAFVAEAASALVAENLGAAQGEAVLTLDRRTWRGARSITTTRIAFTPGHRILTEI